MPDPKRLEAASHAVGYQHLVLDPIRRTAELRRPKMRLDLGGIAKGYALDEALRTLERCGVSRALVTGGGDMVAGDAPPGKAGWRIEVAPLDRTNAPPARSVLLRRQALATPGDLLQYLEHEGQRYSHIVNPRTGIGLTDHSLVTVIAPDGMKADALSTAVSVLGPEAGLRLVESERGAAVHLVRQPGAVIEERTSRRFPPPGRSSGAPRPGSSGRRRKLLRRGASLLQSPPLKQASVHRQRWYFFSWGRVCR